jgi:hypothetical protein
MSEEAQKQEIATKQVVYRLPGMAEVETRKDVPYGPARDGSLTMDLYYPAGRRVAPNPSTLPAVILVAGYPDRGFQAMLGCRFKEMGSSVSWARLIAASGMAAITYANHEPAADLGAVLDHVRRHAGELGVDPTRLALWASSGNVPLALAALMETANSFTCATLCYGLTMDLDGSTFVADSAKSYRFVNPAAGRSVEDLPADVPLLLARAGQDQFAGLNGAMDRFIAHALRRNLPISVVNHPTGPHAFDLFDDSEASREIVRSVLRFLQFHSAVS